MGKNTEALKTLKDNLQLENFYFTQSGSHDLYWILKGLELQAYDEVILLIYMCKSVYQAVIAVGARPILCDLKETGISFFELSDGVDDGLLYDQEKFPINPSDYITDLVDKSRLAILEMLKRTLPKIINNKKILYPQIGIPSYCGQRKPEDSLIDWTMPALDILWLIRASSRPYAGAYTFLDNQKITIWKAQISLLEILGVPGQILVVGGNAYIACSCGALLINEADEVELLMKANHKKVK